jgi:hypothetical protein
MSKSDPFARILWESTDGSLHEMGRTEVIMNTQEPEWEKPVQLDWRPEVRTCALFEVRTCALFEQTLPTAFFFVEILHFCGCYSLKKLTDVRALRDQGRPLLLLEWPSCPPLILALL